MSDNTAEDASALRRRKVLANSQKRMERLQRLKRAEIDNKVTENSENIPDVFNVKNDQKEEIKLKNEESSSSTRLTNSQETTDNIGKTTTATTTTATEATEPGVDDKSESNMLNSNSVFSGDESCSTPLCSQENDKDDIMNIGDEDGCQHEADITTSMPSKSSLGSEDWATESPIADFIQQARDEEGADDVKNVESGSTEEDSSPLSWFFRKRRLVIFMLLALVSYCIAHKGLDVYLSALLGSAWKQGGIGKDSFAKLYGAVELQMLVVVLMGGNVNDTGGSTPALLRLALNMSGVPKPLLGLVGKLFSCVQMVVTDFCVYLFTYVMLCQVGF